MKKIILFVFILFINKEVKADLGEEMNKFWGNVGGGSSNVNQAYADQSAGYYTGGSFNTRTQVLQQRPFNIQAPKISAGCGGIDMFTGSFSHINLDQFVAQMKAISSNAVGYAFQIGLETMSPMIASTMSKLQETIDTINGININSCESAKLLVDGVVGRSISLKESTCAQMALITGSASDADAAKSRCKSQTAQKQEDNKQPDSEKIMNINYTWQALKNDGYVDSLGIESSEAFMSMVGTIIYRDDKVPQFIAPIIFDDNYSKSLVEGGNIKIKKCDETSKCLGLTDKEINISGNVAYKPRIKSLLQSMQNKIINTANGSSDEVLSDAEKALIEQVDFPILRIMVNTATRKSPITTDILADIVAKRMLNNFLTSIAGSLEQEVIKLELKNNNEIALNKLSDNIRRVKAFLENNRKKIDSDFRQVQDVIDTNQKLDAEFASQFSGHIKSVLDFSNSISNGGNY